MNIPRIILLATLLAACGGGDSGTNSPPPSPTVAAITVTLAQPSVAVGAVTSANAVLRDGNGGVLGGKAVTWTSSSPTVASVASNGQIAALAPGTTQIRATADGVTGSAPLTVGPAPVASVTVALVSTILAPGATTVASATTRDANGGVLVGRAVTWSTNNAAIATVDAGGTVTAVAEGMASITGTSGGHSGMAQLTVTAPPVVTVDIFGTQRVKVGDSYTLTIEARLADGTLVERPIVWEIPVAGSMTITPAGVLTPLQSGTLNFSVTVDGVTTSASVTAYDWEMLSEPGLIGLYLPSNNEITTQLGQSEYPQLLIGCVSGTFVVGVGMQHFITASGLVSYSFNGGTIFSGTWLEGSDFRTLTYPGPTNLAQKSFANQIAASSTFIFAFSEYLAGAHAMTFRVTGLASILGNVTSACPSNSLRADGGQAPTLADALARFLGPAEASALRSARAEATANHSSGTPSVRAPLSLVSESSVPARVLLSHP